MRKISEFIVKARYVLLAVFVGLVALSCVLMTKVNINYNLLSYLDKDSSSTVALNKMEEEFGSSGQAQVMVKGVTYEVAVNLKEEISNVSGVASVVFASSETDTEYFVLDENGTTGSALYKIFLDSGNFDLETEDTVANIRDVLSEYNIALNGGAIDAIYLSDSLDSDMTKILLIAIAIVFAILLITSTSWIEPFIFAIVAGGAILINMGTNILLNHISYINNSMSFITQSIAAVMQLALAMDYSIILLNSFKEEKKTTASSKDALINALTKSFAPISSSSITTVVGLVALMFMSFSIGFDVGLVLSKGIIISLLSVFLFMPALLIIFDKLIVKTTHKTLKEFISEKSSKKETKYRKPSLANYQNKTKILVPVLATLLIIIGAVLNFKADYNYSIDTSTDANATINTDNDEITALFGTQNTLVVMIPKDKMNLEKEIANYLLNYTDKDGNKVVNSYQGLGSYGIYTEMTAQMISVNFGLSESIVDEVYTLMGIEEGKTTTIYELVDFMVKNNVATSMTQSLQAKVNQVYKAYTTSLTSAQFASLYNLNSSFVAQIYTACAKESMTTYEVLKNVNDNKLVATIFDSIETNQIDANYQQLVQAGLFNADNTLNQTTFVNMKAYCEAYEAHTAGYDDAAKYAQYKTLTTNLTKEEAMKQFAFLTSEVASQIYANNQSIPYCSLIQAISLNKIAKKYGVAAQTQFETMYNQIPALDGIITRVDAVSTYVLNDTATSALFNGTNTVTNQTLFTFLSSNDYYTKYGKELSSTLASTMDELNLAVSMFESDNYVRMIFNMDMEVATNDSFDIINDIADHIEANYEDVMIVSDSYVYSQIKDTYNNDMVVVNLISFFAIVLIIAITFKSLFIPVLLTVIIQGSIWITMGISTMAGTNIFFVCYLVVMCIQMGATVDYAILISNNYINNRKSMNKKDAIAKALTSAIPTILTSGSILILATLIIGLVSKVSIVSELGLLLSRGCLVSVIMILLCLPQCLLLSDKVIEKTTYKANFYKD